MSITREQVADLRVGDVVRVDFGDGSYLQGPLQRGRTAELLLSPLLRLRRTDGGCSLPANHTLTVVSRAPRLYVNHDRTEPVPGDVVRQEGGCPSGHTWHYLGGDDISPQWWRFDDTRIPFDEGAPLRLLVDGETGQVVP